MSPQLFTTNMSCSLLTHAFLRKMRWISLLIYHSLFKWAKDNFWESYLYLFNFVSVKWIYGLHKQMAVIFLLYRILCSVSLFLVVFSQWNVSAILNKGLNLFMIFSNINIRKTVLFLLFTCNNNNNKIIIGSQMSPQS